MTLLQCAAWQKWVIVERMDMMFSTQVRAQNAHSVISDNDGMDDSFRRKNFYHTSAMSWRSKSVSLIRIQAHFKFMRND